MSTNGAVMYLRSAELSVITKMPSNQKRVIVTIPQLNTLYDKTFMAKVMAPSS